ncbi:MAG: glycosyltransferase, partial [Anaerolineae bacterium]|nr:glycosyltransferase [Anaerolineae bacterium]
ERPLWSVMVPTYNCANYLRFTLESILAQDPGPEVMQIEVVDDCSTKDDPEAVVQEIGRGRVQFFRKSNNEGAIANFNTCVQRSRGHLIHILHGDDLVKPGFYHRLGQPLLADEAIGAAFCRQEYINEQGDRQLITRCHQEQSGVMPDALSVLAVTNRIQPPAIVVRRHVYETLGGYNARLFHSADWEMWVRIAARYPIWFEADPLAAYRVHAQSDTSKLFRTGANIQERRLCIDICRHYFPSASAGRLYRKALGYSALYAAKTASRFLTAGHWQIALIQLREAALCLLKLYQPTRSPLS